MDESVSDFVLSFKDVDGTTFGSALNDLKVIMSKLYKQHKYLLDSDIMDEYDKEQFTKILCCHGSLTETMVALFVLMSRMSQYYGKPVVLLIHEYDVPTEKSICNNYYKEMYEVMRAIFSTTLKFAIVTGCLKSIEEIIFTGINDFVSGRIPTTTYDKYYRFTQEDINKFYLY